MFDEFVFDRRYRYDLYRKKTMKIVYFAYEQSSVKKIVYFATKYFAKKEIKKFVKFLGILIGI